MSSHLKSVRKSGGKAFRIDRDEALTKIGDLAVAGPVSDVLRVLRARHQAAQQLHHHREAVAFVPGVDLVATEWHQA